MAIRERLEEGFDFLTTPNPRLADLDPINQTPLGAALQSIERIQNNRAQASIRSEQDRIAPLYFFGGHTAEQVNALSAQHDRRVDSARQADIQREGLRARIEEQEGQRRFLTTRDRSRAANDAKRMAAQNEFALNAAKVKRAQQVADEESRLEREDALKKAQPDMFKGIDGRFYIQRDGITIPAPLSPEALKNQEDFIAQQEEDRVEKRRQAGEAKVSKVTQAIVQRTAEYYGLEEDMPLAHQVAVLESQGKYQEAQLLRQNAQGSDEPSKGTPVIQDGISGHILNGVFTPASIEEDGNPFGKLGSFSSGNTGPFARKVSDNPPPTPIPEPPENSYDIVKDAIAGAGKAIIPGAGIRSTAKSAGDFIFESGKEAIPHLKQIREELKEAIKKDPGYQEFKGDLGSVVDRITAPAEPPSPRLTPKRREELQRGDERKKVVIKALKKAVQDIKDLTKLPQEIKDSAIEIVQTTGKTPEEAIVLAAQEVEGGLGVVQEVLADLGEKN